MSLCRARSLVAVAGALAAAFCAWTPPRASAAPGDIAVDCVATDDALDLGGPLVRVARAAAERREVRIVAFGSSSTEGYGASSKDNTTGRELVRTLARRLPGVQIKMSEKGVGGQDVVEMLDRLDRDVLDQGADLVIWQVGTNAAVRGFDLAVFRARLAHGIDRMKAAGLDVVLLDQQYVPLVVDRPDEEEYVAAVAATAHERGVGLFSRFAVMRHWVVERKLPYGAFTIADKLHLNDFGYLCIGRLLAAAIARALPGR